MSTTEVTVAVAVASDRSLVADAVATALAGGSLGTVRIPWPAERRDRVSGWPDGSPPPEQALMLCDLEPSSLEAARWVVRRYPAQWLLLTDAPRGPLWGAMIEVGVAHILPSSTTMADVLHALAAARQGAVGNGRTDRDELVGLWHRQLAARAAARARMSTVTGRERQVLRQLHLGRTVVQIAAYNEVAPSTVRSQVRSLLRKLGVNSQLAAAAHYERWGDTP